MFAQIWNGQLLEKLAMWLLVLKICTLLRNYLKNWILQGSNPNCYILVLQWFLITLFDHLLPEGIFIWQFDMIASLEAEVSSGANCSFIIVFNMMVWVPMSKFFLIKISKTLATWIYGGSLNSHVSSSGFPPLSLN